MQREFCEDHPELMDLESSDINELKADLKNLELLNRYFGGSSAVQKVLKNLSSHLTSVRLIDLATGYGDHPRTMSRWMRSRGQKHMIVAVDRQIQTLQMARRATPSEESIFFVQADIRKLPFKKNCADFAFCSLVLHHFSETDAKEVLKEARRIASKAAACIDLVRSRIAYTAVWLITQFIFRLPMTRHDARISVKRAFTTHEFKEIAQKAGWDSFRHSTLPWFRQVVVSPKDYA